VGRRQAFELYAIEKNKSHRTFVASCLSTKRAFTSPPPPKLYDCFYTHLVRYIIIIPILHAEL